MSVRVFAFWAKVSRTGPLLDTLRNEVTLVVTYR
ncbi:MAG: hypothetical protein JWO09_2683 [Bacteroidetes bacterium]|nr:hypothetical protein [Bacteroidota bacterium]